MSWTGWLLVAAVGVGVIAIQFIPEVFHATGKFLDRLSPRIGLAILSAIIVVGLLAGLAVRFMDAK